MAMTKKEAAYVADLERRRAEAMALRFTEPKTPDVPPPQGGPGMRYTFGFRAHSYDLTFSAGPAVSSCIGHHSYYQDAKGFHRSGGSQKSIRLCSTRLLALQVARNMMENEAARALAKLDAEIEHERANPTPHPERDA